MVETSFCSKWFVFGFVNRQPATPRMAVGPLAVQVLTCELALHPMLYITIASVSARKSRIAGEVLVVVVVVAVAEV